MSEPDYEAVAAVRAEERGEAWLHRLDVRYGTVEQYAAVAGHDTEAGEELFGGDPQ